MHLPAWELSHGSQSLLNQRQGLTATGFPLTSSLLPTPTVPLAGCGLLRFLEWSYSCPQTWKPVLPGAWNVTHLSQREPQSLEWFSRGCVCFKGWLQGFPTFRVIKIKLENLVSVECLHFQELLTPTTLLKCNTMQSPVLLPKKLGDDRGDGVQYKLTGFL